MDHSEIMKPHYSQTRDPIHNIAARKPCRAKKLVDTKSGETVLISSFSGADSDVMALILLFLDASLRFCEIVSVNSRVARKATTHVAMVTRGVSSIALSI